MRVLVCGGRLWCGDGLRWHVSACDGLMLAWCWLGYSLVLAWCWLGDVLVRAGAGVMRCVGEVGRVMVWRWHVLARAGLALEWCWPAMS